MLDIARIDEQSSVSGQITSADIPQIAAAGIKHIVNNRPDGEAPGQMSAAEIETAARDHGVSFLNLPFSGATLTPHHVAKFAALLQGTDDMVLAYCRTGNRSSLLWAAANVALGQPIEEVLARTAAAGYDHSHAANIIEGLGQAAAKLFRC